MELNQGPLKSLEVPASWRREDSYARGPRIRFTPVDGADLSFVVLSENRCMSAASMKAYAELLEGKTAEQLNVKLSARQIRSIREILGSTTVGDNQYSNQNPVSDPRGPAFNLSSAQFIELNGKLVLEVKGCFVGKMGKPLNFTRAIFVLCSDGRVLKLFLQTPSQDHFIIGSRVFSEISASLSWH